MTLHLILKKIVHSFQKICFYWKILKYCHSLNRLLVIDNNNNKNVGLLLAGGYSSRFNSSVPKQLYAFNEKLLIEYSIELLVKHLDTIIIVTNSKCYLQITNLLVRKNYTNKIFVIQNDINCRLESIECGLNYINNNIPNIHFKNIIIHDSARPFIPDDYIINLLSNTKYYSQYCLKLTNGLIDDRLNTLDRDKYLELCSPICMNYNLCSYIFFRFITKKHRNVHEFIDILSIYRVTIDLLYGEYKYLKKITYLDDLLD